jgi:hypothetical protein
MHGSQSRSPRFFIQTGIDRQFHSLLCGRQSCGVFTPPGQCATQRSASGHAPHRSSTQVCNHHDGTRPFDRRWDVMHDDCADGLDGDLQLLVYRADRCQRSQPALGIQLRKALKQAALMA